MVVKDWSGLNKSEWKKNIKVIETQYNYEGDLIRQHFVYWLRILNFLIQISQFIYEDIKTVFFPLVKMKIDRWFYLKSNFRV